ncbi:hypothetical protein M3J09_005699 [Ascochyta lentis]
MCTSCSVGGVCEVQSLRGFGLILAIAAMDGLFGKVK